MPEVGRNHRPDSLASAAESSSASAAESSPALSRGVLAGRMPVAVSACRGAGAGPTSGSQACRLEPGAKPGTGSAFARLSRDRARLSRDQVRPGIGSGHRGHPVRARRASIPDDVLRVARPVLRSSARGLALPSSVAGGDGTRLKYRSGMALRTNSRVARKCSPFLVGVSTTRLIGPRVPSMRPSRCGPFAACQVRPSRPGPEPIREDPDLTDHLGTIDRPFPQKPQFPQETLLFAEIHPPPESEARANDARTRE